MIEKDRYGVLINNTIVFAIGNLLVKLISFFFMPLYTYVLTAEQYGIAELINSINELLFPVVSLCVVDALYRFSIDDNSEHAILFTNSAVIIICSDVLVGILCIIYWKMFSDQHVVYFFFLYIAMSFYKLTTQFARGLGHTKEYSFYGILNAFILLILSYILLVICDLNIKGYLMAYMVAYFISAIVAFAYSKEFQYFNIVYFEPRNLQAMLVYSMPGIPNMIFWWFNTIFSRYIVLYFCGAATAGLYTAASKLPAIINVFSSIFQQAWQYSTAKEIGREDNENFFSNVFRFYSYFCFLLCSLIIVLNKYIIAFLLQESFYESWKYVPPLLIAATIGATSTYFGTFYNALKNNTMLMYSTMLGAIFNIIMCIMLTPMIGAFGAALSTMISYMLITIIRVIHIRKILNIDVDWILFIRQAFLTMAIALFGYFDNIISFWWSIILLLSLFLSDRKSINTIFMYIKIM